MSNSDEEKLNYEYSCWHCNPNRHIKLRPATMKPFRKKNRITKSKNILRSFNKSLINKAVDVSRQGTHIYTPQDIIYSRQRSFMKIFGIDVLNKDDILRFMKIIKTFMLELDYNPTDKSDVFLFYSQESDAEIYDVHLARNSKWVNNYLEVFGINSLNFTEVAKFMQTMRCYTNNMLKSTPTTSQFLQIFKTMNPDQIYIEIQMSKIHI